MTTRRAIPTAVERSHAQPPTTTAGRELIEAAEEGVAELMRTLPGRELKYATRDALLTLIRVGVTRVEIEARMRARNR